MRCKVNDLAIILRSTTGTNDGKIVTVSEYIGYYNQKDTFEYNGIVCRVPITDNYWWITAPNTMDTHYGPTTKAYSPDTWLKPLRGDLTDGEESGSEIYDQLPQTVS